MLQVQNLFALTIAAWMLSHQPTLMMNLDSRWRHSHSRFKTCSQRRRVEIGSRLHAALFVHLPEILFRQFEVLALQRNQMWLFKGEPVRSNTPPDFRDFSADSVAPINRSRPSAFGAFRRLRTHRGM